MVPLEEEASSTLADRVYRSIRIDIISGVLKADQKLKMVCLCKKYGIASSPLREALARLVGDNLVVAESYRGFWVVPQSCEEIIDIFSVLKLLEGQALQSSMENTDVLWRKKMSDALLCFESSKEGERGYAYKQFHRSLTGRCCSPWLARCLDVMFVQSERYHHFLLEDIGHDDAANEQMRAICNAAVGGNILRATRLVEKHLHLTRDAILRRYRV